MEEDIMLLENVIKLKKQGLCYEQELTRKFYGAIENLIARYKELEKHYQHEQEYINGEVFSAKQMHYIEDNYIDKSKVKEKIEDLGKRGYFEEANAMKDLLED